MLRVRFSRMELEKPMKNLTLLIISALTVLVAAEPALAARERIWKRGHRPRERGNERSERVRNVPVGQLSYGGNGCPAGTTQVSFAPDNLSFSILFDNFVAETNPSARQPRDVMRCNLVIPLDIPEGLRARITRVDYRGFVGIPAQGSAKLRSMYSFTMKRRGPRNDPEREGEQIFLTETFRGPIMEDYFLSSDVMQDQDIVSPCGGPTRLRINNEIVIQSRDRTQESRVTIDSIDGTGNTIYYLNWERCTDTSDDGTNNRTPGRGDGRGEGRGSSGRFGR